MTRRTSFHAADVQRQRDDRQCLHGARSDLLAADRRGRNSAAVKRKYVMRGSRLMMGTSLPVDLRLQLAEGFYVDSVGVRDGNSGVHGVARRVNPQSW